MARALGLMTAPEDTVRCACQDCSSGLPPVWRPRLEVFGAPVWRRTPGFRGDPLFAERLERPRLPVIIGVRICDECREGATAAGLITEAGWSLIEFSLRGPADRARTILSFDYVDVDQEILEGYRPTDDQTH